MNADPCCICSQIAGDSSNDLISKSIGSGPYVRRVAIEDDDFAMLPSIGPVAPGHSLICPKRHVRSFAQLDQQETTSLDAFRRWAFERLKRVSTSPVHLFEHGSSVLSMSGPCTVDHAHLHLLPASVHVLDQLLRCGQWIEIGSSFDAFKEAAGDKEYLYYETPHARRFVLRSSGVPFESQYLRRVFAEAHGSDRDWNWRREMNIREVEETYQALAH